MSIKPVIFLLLCSLFCGAVLTSPPKKISLFNGKDLSNWDSWLGPVFDSTKNHFDSLDVPGLNKDPHHVFSVVKDGNQSVIRITGQYWGGISTKEEYKNYHLQMEFKWGKLKWRPRADQKRDNGVVYHGVGPQGAAYGFWLQGLEYQVQEGDCGDFWSVAGSIADIPSVRKGETWVYDPSAGLNTFSYTSSAGKRCWKIPGDEKPNGEWNLVDIYCYGDSSVHVLNGVVKMRLFHAQQVTPDGPKPLRMGKIQIQSEGAEAFYRNIQIESIKKIPDLK